MVVLFHLVNVAEVEAVRNWGIPVDRRSRASFVIGSMTIGPYAQHETFVLPNKTSAIGDLSKTDDAEAQ